MEGLVLRAQSGFFWVQTETAGILECRLRGRLKKERQATDIAVIGDRVLVQQVSPTEGAIEAVLPRQTRLARRASGSRGAWKEDVIVANVDQVLLVFACTAPELKPRMLDRYLVICEHSELDTLIIANKVDLMEAAAARALFAVYEQIGYPVVYTSIVNGCGIAELRERMAGRISVLTGKSGVGKSSLLNAVQPELARVTADMSSTLNKGRHTTTTAELLPLQGPAGGYMADTPGIREIGLWRFPLEDLDWCFREFRPYLDDCYFAGCTHTHEPDCAVRAALAAERISRQRYESYVKLRADEN
jgi:ribosome biogenesis GTPase / thiamine phosphate phosphatase